MLLLCCAQARAADAWWAYDKGEHWIATTAIASAGAELPRFAIESRLVRLGIGFGAAVVVGAGKELLDLTGFGDPSWKDFTWDVIGAATGALISIGVESLFEWLLAR